MYEVGAAVWLNDLSAWAVFILLTLLPFLLSSPTLSLTLWLSLSTSSRVVYLLCSTSVIWFYSFCRSDSALFLPIRLTLVFSPPASLCLSHSFCCRFQNVDFRFVCLRWRKNTTDIPSIFYTKIKYRSYYIIDKWTSFLYLHMIETFTAAFSEFF